MGGCVGWDGAGWEVRVWVGGDVGMSIMRRP